MNDYELIIIREDPQEVVSFELDNETYSLVVIQDEPEFEMEVEEVTENEFELVMLLDNVVVNNYYGGEAGKAYDETPAGAINGSNAAFSTASNFVSESLEVILNGLTLTRIEDFTVTGPNSFQLAASPLAGEILRVNYTKS